MNTNKIVEKRRYNSPKIVCIQLDNEISLALESSPPIGPSEGALMRPDNINNNPFKANII